jgi:hypothetical protein
MIIALPILIPMNQIQLGLMTAQVTATAVQNIGLLMDMQIVKIRPMAVILAVITMMVVIVVKDLSLSVYQTTHVIILMNQMTVLGKDVIGMILGVSVIQSQ